jgi:hypothetical protein
MTISFERLDAVLFNSFPQTDRPVRRYRPVAAIMASVQRRIGFSRL